MAGTIRFKRHLELQIDLGMEIRTDCMQRGTWEGKGEGEVTECDGD